MRRTPVVLSVRSIQQEQGSGASYGAPRTWTDDRGSHWECWTFDGSVHYGYIIEKVREEQTMPITGTAYQPSVAPGIHQAVITNIEDVESKTDPGQYFRGWEFTLADDSGRTVRASSSLATSPKSKGGKWIAALIGHPLAEGETVELVGMHCTIVVGLKENGYETVETVAAPDKGNKPRAHAPVAATIQAAEQHAIQEGYAEPVEPTVLP